MEDKTNYFNKLIKFVNLQNKEEILSFKHFIENNSIKFFFFKKHYDLSKLELNYDNIIRNKSLFDFYGESSIIKLYHSVLKSNYFQIANFFTFMLMNAKGNSTKASDELHLIKLKIFNDPIVSSWINKNHNKIKDQILNNYHNPI